MLDDSETNKDKRFVNFEDVNFNMKNSQFDEQNFDYLKNSLKYLGFGENLNPALEVRLKEGSDKFSLGATAGFKTPVANDLVNYELRFSKSKTTEKYFLNNYQATLEKGNPNGSVQESVSKLFHLNVGNDITAKEAYNLLSGRSIQKKADVSDKLTVIAGTDEVTKVIKLNEAIAKIQELAKTSGVSNNYSIVGKDNIVIKSFDKNAKEQPVKHRKNLQLIQTYIQKNDKGNDYIPYEVQNMVGAVKKIKELITDKNTQSITLTEKGVPIALFDSKGKEIDLPIAKHKEEVWLKLDFEKKNEQGDHSFKTFYKNYGFDLDKAIVNHPIRELNDPDKREQLMAALKRGNLQSVTLVKDGEEQKAFVAASPQFKNISLFDKHLKLVYEKPQEIKVQNQQEQSHQLKR